MGTTLFAYNDYGVVNDGVVESKGAFSFYMACLLRGNDSLYSMDESLNSFSFSFVIQDKGSFSLTQFISKASYAISNGSTNVTKEVNPVISSGTASFLTVCDSSELLLKERLFYFVTLTFDFPTENFKSTVADNMPNADLSVYIDYEASK